MIPNSNDAPPAHAVAARVERGLSEVGPWINHLWRVRRRLARRNAAVAVFAAATLLLVVPVYFDSSVAILPDLARPSTGMLSQLSGLASLSGLGNLALGRGVAPEVYENLLSSEAVLTPVLRRAYRTAEYPQGINLIDYLEIEPDPRAPERLVERQRLLDAIEEFQDEHLGVNIDRISGIVTVTVRMPESALSAAVANELVSSLDLYMVAQGQRVAGETMRYLESRVTEGLSTLRAAEETLKQFSERNRVVGSPALALEELRLRRDVELKQAIYVELQRQFEIARIETLKETPTLTVRELAGEPVLKTGPKRTLLLILTLLISATATMLWELTGLRLSRAVAILTPGPTSE